MTVVRATFPPTNSVRLPPPRLRPRLPRPHLPPHLPLPLSPALPHLHRHRHLLLLPLHPCRLPRLLLLHLRPALPLVLPLLPPLLLSLRLLLHRRLRLRVRGPRLLTFVSRSKFLTTSLQ